MGELCKIVKNENKIYMSHIFGTNLLVNIELFTSSNINNNSQMVLFH